MIKDGCKISLLAAVFLVNPAHADDSDLKPEPPQAVAQNQHAVVEPPSTSPNYHQTKDDDDQRGQTLTEEEQSAFMNDQNQYEQAQAGLNPALDQQNNELRDRVAKEQTKLQSDTEKNNALATEDDKKQLSMDKDELREQESLAANEQTQTLNEFHDPEASQDLPITADSTPATPEPTAAPQRNELAMNDTPPKIPW
jgi:hypothetical protein